MKSLEQERAEREEKRKKDLENQAAWAGKIGEYIKKRDKKKRSV